ncbi:MAG: 16S rRNA (guanine(527)-N(7))-methyltransferase RsmG [Bacteroidales bacterium]|nr:16S rRNA (guanine(527)-N(7))-methyltransferase RsmG [Bacteroidales bacterium]
MDFKEFSRIISEKFPLTTPLQMVQFAALEGLYNDWNSKINVISRKDMDGLYLHHVLHSLAIAAYMKAVRSPEDLSGEVLDLGTGGGFPGIPLAILYPEARFTLCDSVGKKTIVASEVAKAINLQNVEVVNARAESLGKTFDYVVSRAVTSLDNFYPWVKGRFTKRILYLKGGDVVEEIATLMGKNRMKKGQVGTFRIQDWVNDEYFEGKLVIDIAKK